jgi:hypothetical protein
VDQNGVAETTCRSHLKDYERGEGGNVAAVGEDRFKLCERSLKPRRQTSKNQARYENLELHREPLFDVLPTAR